MSSDELSAYERWMVRSNLVTAHEENVTVRELAGILRANGYLRVACALEAVSFDDSKHADLRAINALGMHRELGGCDECRE